MVGCFCATRIFCDSYVQFSDKKRSVIKQVMVDTDYLLLPEFKQRKKETAAWLAQLGERRSAEREVTGSNPDRTNTQGL